MPFAAAPKESKKQINKAGEILTRSDASDEELDWAQDLADRWRACHAYPINTFQANLRLKLKHYLREPIAAQRLKRMPTIIDKLKRFPAMKLTTMQDIGGIRAIVSTVTDVYHLAEEFRKSRFEHELVDEKDYIQNPRSEDGYRSLHLVYRYCNQRAPDYNGLRLELQIRTKIQHTWATAVETMGTFLGQALKSRQGDQDWLDFFAIVSSAFACQERSPLVPRYSSLSHEQTWKKVAAAERRLHALDIMRGLSVAANAIAKGRSSGKAWHYHLIILNSLEKTVKIVPYDRESIEQALTDYSNAEADAARGEKIEPVLVSAGPIERLRHAYPNFFLDIDDFALKVKDITTLAKIKKK